MSADQLVILSVGQIVWQSDFHKVYMKSFYSQDLMNDLKSELSGNLEECLLAMMEPTVLYDAKCLRRAMRVYEPCMF